MSLVDYEQAWIRLTQLVASKSHHGSDKLLAEMQRILAQPDIRMAESTPERMLRLYGVQLGELYRDQRDAAPDAAGDSIPGGMVAVLDHERPGGHDGHSRIGRGGAPSAAGAGGSPHAGRARPRAGSAA